MCDVCVMVYLCVMCVKGLVMCDDVPLPVGTGTTKSLS